MAASASPPPSADPGPLPRAPARPVDGHKGTFGTVIIVGGCATMPGAPALCARAAIRGGTGLVRIAALPKVLAMSLVIEPHATGIELPEQPQPGWLDAHDPARRAVLAVGPGLSTAPFARHTLAGLLDDPRAMVLDADGLNLLAELGPTQIAPSPDTATGPRILTPHPGEFARLAEALDIPPIGHDSDSRRAGARTMAQRLGGGAVVVLKGAGTVITDGIHTAINPTGHPALAVGGSGDVLTGLIAALLAQGMPPFNAARLAAWMHGAAAELWATRRGPAGLRAVELADLLPHVRP